MMGTGNQLSAADERFIDFITAAIRRAKARLRADLIEYMGPGAWALDAYNYLLSFSGEDANAE